MKFKSYLEHKNLSEEMEDKIMLLMYLSENENVLNENLQTLSEKEITEGVNKWLDKVGMKLHKGNGIIDYLLKFSKGTGQIIMAAIKKDDKKVKEIASKLEKSHIIDFLLKLDMATMHIVTGPIHFIDAVTGWDLMANLNHAAEGAKDKIATFYQAMKSVKDSIKSLLTGDKQTKMLKVAGNIEYNMPDA